jgi:hypothetical protein
MVRIKYSTIKLKEFSMSTITVTLPGNLTVEQLNQIRELAGHAETGGKIVLRDQDAAIDG